MANFESNHQKSNRTSGDPSLAIANWCLKARADETGLKLMNFGSVSPPGTPKQPIFKMDGNGYFQSFPAYIVMIWNDPTETSISKRVEFIGFQAGVQKTTVESRSCVIYFFHPGQEHTGYHGNPKPSFFMVSGSKGTR